MTTDEAIVDQLGAPPEPEDLDKLRMAASAAQQFANELAAEVNARLSGAEATIAELPYLLPLGSDQMRLVRSALFSMVAQHGQGLRGNALDEWPKGCASHATKAIELLSLIEQINDALGVDPTEDVPF